jgi:hypothetical protein
MSTTCHWTIYESPLGALTLARGRRGLSALRFAGREGPLDEQLHDPAAFARVIRELDA